LPDAAKAFAQVAALRITEIESPNHMVLPFSGHVFSFGQLQGVFESIKGRRVKVSQVPWVLFSVMGWIVAFMRALVSTRYLWQHDIRMDGSALIAYLGAAPEHTALEEAVFSSVPQLVDSTHNETATRAVIG